jgi:hypothetical protein
VLVGVLLGLMAMLGAQRADAQIVHKKPGQVKAANRRALRDAERTDAPYKDTHLNVKPARLKRGQSTQPQPEIGDELLYKTGTAPNVRPAGILGARRKRKA